MSNDPAATRPASAGGADERLFPIQHHPTIKYIPWKLVEPGREQVMKNHGQTLERLAQRGGLAPGELWCALESRGLFDQKWTSAFHEWCDKWLVLLVASNAPRMSADE